MPHSVFLNHTSETEILEIINNLENKYTGVPIKLLKIIPDLILTAPWKWF